MPPNFILSEIMLKSYIGYEIMLYENMLFTAHLQVLQPYIRIESEQTYRPSSLVIFRYDTYQKP